jgi:hypothetical protein
VATLGDITTVGDWERRFAGELEEAPWADVVGRWLPRLLPGVMAAATHGWLRTAHAARALLARDSPARRAELARGLAYWAARYQELPGPMQPTGTRSLAAAVSSLPARSDDGPGLIFERVRALDGDAGFTAAVESADPSVLTADGLLAAAATVIRAGNADAPVVYVHTLTPTAALRSLAGILDPSSLPLALGCTWRAVAALIATYPVAGDDPGEAGEVDAADVVDRAVTGGDEHAIKVAEAAFGPDATLDRNVRAAAASLVDRLQMAS